MQFESEEPSHGAFSSLGYALEDLMKVYSLVSADAERCAVNKADSRTLAQQDLLDKQSQGNGNFPFQFYETIIGDNFGEQMAKMLAYFFKIKMLEATIAGIVKENQSMISAFDMVESW